VGALRGENRNRGQLFNKIAPYLLDVDPYSQC
jgi:hypothetical protein